MSDNMTTYDNYLSSHTDIQKGRISKQLDKLIRSRDIGISTIHELVEHIIINCNGYTETTTQEYDSRKTGLEYKKLSKPITHYFVTRGNGVGMEVNKTQYDYAIYISIMNEK